jgi:hypothetical protein
MLPQCHMLVAARLRTVVREEVDERNMNGLDGCGEGMSFVPVGVAVAVLQHHTDEVQCVRGEAFCLPKETEWPSGMGKSRE